MNDDLGAHGSAEEHAGDHRGPAAAGRSGSGPETDTPGLRGTQSGELALDPSGASSPVRGRTEVRMRLTTADLARARALAPLLHMSAMGLVARLMYAALEEFERQPLVQQLSADHRAELRQLAIDVKEPEAQDG